MLTLLGRQRVVARLDRLLTILAAV
jgi:hypothetical protein